MSLPIHCKGNVTILLEDIHTKFVFNEEEINHPTSLNLDDFSFDMRIGKAKAKFIQENEHVIEIDLEPILYGVSRFL